MRKLHVTKNAFVTSLLLLVITLLVTACVPVSATIWSTATPEPMRPMTATPAPLSSNAIFVVDPRNGDLVTWILVVDPDARKVERAFQARYTPEIALSPDSRRLYIADSYSSRVIRGDWHDVLSVYDPRTGNLLRDDFEIPKRLLYKVFPASQPFLFLSRDSRKIFVGKYGDPDLHAMRMTVLDAETFNPLAEYRYPACSRILPLSDGRRVSVQQR